MNWRTYTMTELHELLVGKQSGVFQTPTFPTRRWGQIHLSTATTDKGSIDRGLVKLKSLGIRARKRICKDSMAKYPKLGKFYKIEIFKDESNNTTRFSQK